MNHRVTARVETMMTPTEVRNAAATSLPAYDWRTGESEAQGSRYVSGAAEGGPWVKLWFDEEPGAAMVTVSFPANELGTPEQRSRGRSEVESVVAFLETLGEVADLTSVD